jgi:uncharacterized protein (DUF2164 family)
MAISLSPDVTKQLIASLKRYAAEHLDEDVGDLKASLLLDYVLKEIGPVIYNRAIADAQSYFQGRVADLEGVCYEPEFTYWKDARSRRGMDPRKGPAGAASGD